MSNGDDDFPMTYLSNKRCNKGHIHLGTGDTQAKADQQANAAVAACNASSQS